MKETEAQRAIAAAKQAAQDGLRSNVLPIYELGEHEPRAWLDGDGELTPGGRHPHIMWADVPIMLHLTNGHHIAPLSDEMGATEDGHLTGPKDRCPTCSGPAIVDYEEWYAMQPEETKEWIRRRMGQREAV